MKFPQQAWCPTCGQEGTLVTEETDVEGQSVARGISHSMYHFTLRRGGAESDRRHRHFSHWGYFMMACPAGHHFGSRQSLCPPCWCGWQKIQAADSTIIMNNDSLPDRALL
jgi:hypothetical protein